MEKMQEGLDITIATEDQKQAHYQAQQHTGFKAKTLFQPVAAKELQGLTLNLTKSSRLPMKLEALFAGKRASNKSKGKPSILNTEDEDRAIQRYSPDEGKILTS